MNDRDRAAFGARKTGTSAMAIKTVYLETLEVLYRSDRTESSAVAIENLVYTELACHAVADSAFV